MSSQIATPETHASVVPVDHKNSNVSILTAPTNIILPENEFVDSDIHEANDLVIEENCVT